MTMTTDKTMWDKLLTRKGQSDSDTLVRSL